MAAEQKQADPLAKLRTLPPKLEEMKRVAKLIARPGRGILAADESTGTIGKRFAPINVKNDSDNRRRYRELLFTSEGIENYISGVIMFDETLMKHKTTDDKPFAELLRSKVDTSDGAPDDCKEYGVITGIKVDAGALPLPLNPRGTFTQGLTGLDDKGDTKGRASQYYAAGARFAKWRATLQIIDGRVAQESIQETAWTLARYAAICQKHGLVPIVEPELLMDGNHSLAECQYWTEKIVTACYKALSDQEVVLEATLLKPNMCLPGKNYTGASSSVEDIGRATAQMLLRSVPAAVPGITFLSGGQAEEEASLTLNAINALQGELGPFPWNISFSYGRALQKLCLEKWVGDDANIKAAQEAFLGRARANSAANLGKYTPGSEKFSGADNFVSNYTY